MEKFSLQQKFVFISTLAMSSVFSIFPLLTQELPPSPHCASFAFFQLFAQSRPGKLGSIIQITMKDAQFI